MDETDRSAALPDTGDLPVLTRLPEKNRKAGGNMKYFVIAAVCVVVLAVVIAIVVAARRSGKRSADDSTAEAVPGSEEVDPDEIMERMRRMESEVTSVTFSDTAPVFDADVGDFTTNTILTTSATHEDADARPAQQQPASQPPASSYTQVPATVSDKPAGVTEAQLAQIGAFFEKRFYMRAHMISGSDTNDLELAMNGDDIEASSEIDGKPVSILRLGGKTYFVNPKAKQYMTMSAAVMRLMGVKDDDLDLKLGDASYNASRPDAVTEAEYGGEKAVCCEYRDESGGFCRVILVGNELREIGTYSADGTKTSTLQCETFSGEIPSGKLTLNGLEKVSMIGFMSELM